MIVFLSLTHGFLPGSSPAFAAALAFAAAFGAFAAAFSKAAAGLFFASVFGVGLPHHLHQMLLSLRHPPAFSKPASSGCSGSAFTKALQEELSGSAFTKAWQEELAAFFLLLGLSNILGKPKLFRLTSESLCFKSLAFPKAGECFQLYQAEPCLQLRKL